MNGIDKIIREARRYDRRIENYRPMIVPNFGTPDSLPGPGWLWVAAVRGDANGQKRDGSNPNHGRIYVEWGAVGQVLYARRERDDKVITDWCSGKAEQVMEWIRGESNQGTVMEWIRGESDQGA